MGEEDSYLSNGELYVTTKDGKMVKFDGIKNVVTVTDEISDFDSSYSSYSHAEGYELEFTATCSVNNIGRRDIFTYEFGSARKVRNAIRWYNHLCRLERKFGIRYLHKTNFAIQLSHYKRNNGKRSKAEHAYYDSMYLGFLFQNNVKENNSEQ